MEKLIQKSVPIYFKTDHGQLLWGDCFQLLRKIKAQSIDMIFADPPYFLSNDGITCQSGKMVCVNKAEWDKPSSVLHDTPGAKYQFNKKWIHLCKRILKPDATIWISGTLHNIYAIGMALEEEGFQIINNITWQKTNPPPNLSCRCFTHTTETILWAQKKEKNAHHYFDYKLMKQINGGKQMKDVWTGSTTKPSEKKEGKHPTQKPEYLLERIVLASTKPNQMVLDPFCGSGTTGIAALRHGRRFIGIDSCEAYLQIAKKRLEQTTWQLTLENR